MENHFAIDKNMLLKAIKSFHIVTGIKISLFDVNYEQIMSYPETSCDFCTLTGHVNNLSERCNQSNIDSFKLCKEKQKLAIHTCHAGLIEATSPIIDNNGIVRGYLMFGQISTAENKIEFRKKLRSFLIENNINFDNFDEEKLFKVKRFSEEQISACADLLDMCTKYILFNGYIINEKETFLDKLNNYVSAHLKDNLSIDILMDEFHMSRNALYDASKKYLNVGIAEYIKQYKLNYAKKLLKETKLSIKDVSEECGFSDYNYFCRVFKKEVGKSASKYKQE